MTITARFASTCPTCRQPIALGARIEWTKGEKARHTTCQPAHVAVSSRRVRRERDHEDCLSMGPCGPDCDYADIFGR